MNRLAGQAEIRDRGNGVPAWNTVSDVGAPSRLRGHLAPLLGGVVLIRKPALSLRLDLQGIGLGRVSDGITSSCYSSNSNPTDTPMPRSRYDELHDRYGAILTTKSGTRYERLTAMVFKALAEKDAVIHDVSLIGESEVAHQIDVRITSKGEERRILIECKDFDVSGNKVGLDIVRNFFAVLEDTKVPEGMIITSRGFTADAARYAKAKNIKIVVLRIHEEEDWAGFIRTIVANLMFISLPHTAKFNLHIDRQEDLNRLQSELAKLKQPGGVHIDDPVYVVKDSVKHGFNDFFSAKMCTAIPFTSTPDRMTLRIESDGWRIQVGSGEPIPFTHIDASYDIHKDERTITVNSDRIAELIIKGFGDEDIVIFGDQLERRKIDPNTGEVI